MLAFHETKFLHLRQYTRIYDLKNCEFDKDRVLIRREAMSDIWHKRKYEETISLVIGSLKIICKVSVIKIKLL